ncbi:MAG: hypothetical protein HFG27_08350 [Provencibacterium sp.]|jgi:hypothetical protein|nr:hypothetical protein [Provencibacterium sp.]
MTEHEKNQFLKKISHSQLSRAQIGQYFTAKRIADPYREITLLCNERLIKMISTPQYDYTRGGQFTPKPDDLFTIADLGKNRLAAIRKDNFRFYLPISISILALLIAIGGWFMPITS